MNEELKRKLKKIYDYENNIDFDPFGKDYVPYRPSIREIDKECIEYIKTKIDNVELKRLVLYLKKEEIKNSIKEHEYGIEKEVNKLKILRKEILENDEFIAEEKRIKNWNEEVHNKLIKELENLYKEINQENIYKFIIEKYNENIESYKLTEKITKVFNQEDYLYVSILELLLRKINKEEEPYYEINEKNNRLKETYEFIDEDEQYKKYGLLKLNSNRNLEKPMLNSPPYYIHDNRKGYIVLDSRIPDEALIKLYCLKQDNLITDLSLRANYYMKIQKCNIHAAFEERAFGKYFSFENLKNLIPTKLYSTVTNNSLWINIKNGSITFEELLDDFEIEDEREFIKTQVIHCEYFEDKEKFYISHIDHEYIFYSFDEYEERIKDIEQKGNIKKKLKTFKVDNSRIPFIIDNENILLFFLNQYFKSKDLLLEYFQKYE
ncbi:hypothetical protein [Fusobacterium pseudoperiodonticum]|uniref:hypothetical protein n=1 Tax=Fusobacterium pseudoperiodonticum TaxID=2663009 RepID=UPI000C1B8379|nr:hypothetical protein [Fusobacterium pseudoperiodonticum]ATV57524.1 hypothetical protein CTM68_07465 [Fusobacterium pseudoperiodonticum]